MHRCSVLSGMQNHAGRYLYNGFATLCDYSIIETAETDCRDDNCLISSSFEYLWSILMWFKKCCLTCRIGKGELKD